jgi:PKD repeat protein
MGVGFTDQSTGSPTAWNYSFGDGNYSTLENPTHVYYRAGSYTVSLNSSNAAGYKVNKKLSYIEARDASKYSTWQWLFMKMFHWGG